MMRKCIFCKKNLDETQFNAEHIILNSLGAVVVKILFQQCVLRVIVS